MARLPFRIPQLGPRMRKVVRYGGLTFFALVTFVFALQMTFPYNRVKDKIVEALAEKYDVTISSVDRGIIPGRVYFKAVTPRSRQTKPDDVVTTFFIKELRLDAGILPVLGGTLALDMEAKIGAGMLTGAIAVAKFGRGDISVAFNGSSLPADLLPMRGLIGLPMSGKLEFSVNLKLPIQKTSKLGKPGVNWQKVTGGISLGCPSGCTFGDGKTKLKPIVKNTRNQAMVGEGIDFGKITLDSLVAKVSFKAEKLTLDKFEARSKDGELKVDYRMDLQPSFADSQVEGCLRFKGTDDLLKREPKTFAALQTTGAELRADGLFHIRLTDRFDNMKRLNQECGPDGAPPVVHSADRNERPGLSNDGKPAMPTPVTPPTETFVPPPQEAAKPVPEEAPRNPTPEGIEAKEAEKAKEIEKAKEEHAGSNTEGKSPENAGSGSAQPPAFE